MIRIIIYLRILGYYRVNYDKTNWKKIISYLDSDNYSKIHVLNRAQLLNDAFWLFKGKKLDLQIFFDLFSYLGREVDYIPWVPAFQIIDYFFQQTKYTPIYPSFKVVFQYIYVIISQI